MSLIVAEHLVKTYSLGGESLRALDDVGVSIDEGELVAVMGS